MLDVSLLSWKRSPSNSVHLFRLLKVIVMLRELWLKIAGISAVSLKTFFQKQLVVIWPHHQWSVGDTALLGPCGA